MNSNDDLAGKSYWDKNWSMQSITLLDVKDTRLSNEINHRFHQLFCGLLDPARDTGKRLLEVGCARSIWLPYFAMQHGLKVSGLDYSEEGCRQAEAVLAAAGAQGQIVCADMFDPPSDLVGAFDFLLTFGVVEHFTDTSAAIAALANFLKPGGTIITVIPNMNGTTGALQKLFDRSVFDKHVRLGPEELSAAHLKTGLVVKSADYFIASNYYVVNSLHQQGKPFYPLVRLLNGLLGRASMIVWQLERLWRRLPGSRMFSPYVVCVAKRPV